jgi:hypothetical protein
MVYRPPKNILPEPVCKMGFSREQVESIMGDGLAAFDRWMDGSTQALCEGPIEMHFWADIQAHPEYYGLNPHRGCDESHGWITYSVDVENFLAGVRVNPD